jgi:hypothetical protein
MDILKAELQATMGQLGCPTLSALPSFRVMNGTTTSDYRPEKSIGMIAQARMDTVPNAVGFVDGGSANESVTAVIGRGRL